MPTVPIVGLAASNPTPGTYVEIDFGVGPSSQGIGVYGILLIGNKLSTGDATADTVIYGPTSSSPLASLTDAQNRFGIGSELYRMYKRAVEVNDVTPIYAIAVTESVGAKATKNITLATAATANGTLRVYVEDDFVDVAITSGDTADAIKSNAITAINANADWPVVASSGGVGIITLTAQQKGLRGNWLRVGSVILGLSVGTTTDTPPMSFLSSGTTADSYTSALSTIKPFRFYYIVSADDGGQSSTNLSSLLTQVSSQALPTNGIRQTVVAASNDSSSSNVVTQATGINNARLVPYVYLPFSDVAPAELAAFSAAVRALVESSFSAASLNFDSFGNTTVEGIGDTSTIWTIPAPRAGAQLTAAQIITCLNNGITPIGVTATGRTYIVSLITSKSQTNSLADYRIRDGHKVSIADRFGDDVQTACSQQLAGKAIGDDPVDGQRPIPGVATPRNLRAILSTQVKSYGNAGLVQDPKNIITSMTVVRETSPSTRLSAAVPLATADVLHQIGVLISQVQ